MTINTHFGGADAYADRGAPCASAGVDILATQELVTAGRRRAGHRRDRAICCRTTSYRPAVTSVRQRAVEPHATGDDPRRGRDAATDTPLSPRRRPSPGTTMRSPACTPSRRTRTTPADWSDRAGPGSPSGSVISGTRLSSPATSTPPPITNNFAPFSPPGYARRRLARSAPAGCRPIPANRRRVPMLITIDHVLASDGIVATDVRAGGRSPAPTTPRSSCDSPLSPGV